MSSSLLTSTENMIENKENNNSSPNETMSDKLNIFSDKIRRNSVDGKNCETIIKVKSAIPRRRWVIFFISLL